MPLTAVAGVDYVADGNTVSLAAGELSKSIDISITDDSSPELNKTFGVELYDAKHGGNININKFRSQRNESTSFPPSDFAEIA